MKADVTTLDNKSAGTLDLEDGVFGLPARPDLLQRIVRWQLAKRRAGTHQTKVVGDIRGSTAKPFRQKGTGRARQGSSRPAPMPAPFAPAPLSGLDAVGMKSSPAASVNSGSPSMFVTSNPNSRMSARFAVLPVLVLIAAVLLLKA